MKQIFFLCLFVFLIQSNYCCDGDCNCGDCFNEDDSLSSKSNDDKKCRCTEALKRSCNSVSNCLQSAVSCVKCTGETCKEKLTCQFDYQECMDSVSTKVKESSTYYDSKARECYHNMEEQAQNYYDYYVTGNIEYASGVGQSAKDKVQEYYDHYLASKVDYVRGVGQSATDKAQESFDHYVTGNINYARGVGQNAKETAQSYLTGGLDYIRGVEQPEKNESTDQNESSAISLTNVESEGVRKRNLEDSLGDEFIEEEDSPHTQQKEQRNEKLKQKLRLIL